MLCKALSNTKEKRTTVSLSVVNYAKSDEVFSEIK